ncbi:MAG: biotin--[acetyl-CoA-carboxylase] ligase [Opitutales bacterium]
MPADVTSPVPPVPAHALGRGLLARLLAAGEQPVSGPELAEALAVSRVAIKQTIDKLAGEGVPVGAVGRRGYRLTGEPEDWHPLLLGAWLDHRTRNATQPPPGLFFAEQVDSTNTAAERLLAAGTPTPFAVVGGEQLAGRGRLGRRWQSRPGGNLYLTLAFRPPVNPRRIGLLTPWLGIAVCRFLARELELEPNLKWPNDILLGGRKTAGLLAEARIDSDLTREVIVGCGLNFRAPPGGWGDDLSAKATDLMAANGGKPVPAHRVTTGLILALIETMWLWETGTSDHQLPILWPVYDCLKGRRVHIETLGRNEAFMAVVEDLAADGGLRVRREDGRVATVLAGDVTLAPGTL